MSVHLVTFSDESMRRSAELCVESAMRHGVDHAIATRWEAIRNSWKFHGFNDGLRERLRGPAYWSWKPFVILETMKLCADGQTVIYSDAGIEFINNVNYIIDRMDQDIFLFGNNWEHAHWCKQDIVNEVWPQASHQAGCFGKQVQASVIFVRVSDYTHKFVKEWLDWCLFEGGRLIDDSPSRSPNHPEFQENRHDQAILTTMAYRDGIKLHYWPASYNDGAFTYEKLPEYASDDYPILFNHHRRRDHELEQVA